MAETYQFTWGEVEVIEIAIALTRKFLEEVDYAHVEIKSFDLDMDKIGMRIRIPHDPGLDEERKPL